MLSSIRLRSGAALATAIAVLTLTPLGIEVAHATIVKFTDTLRPNGIPRPGQTELRDAQACGMRPDYTYTNISAFESCMRTRGWVVDSVTPEKRDGYGAMFFDLKGPGNRGDRQLQADSRSCERSGSGGPGSATYRQCMLVHGWRYAYTTRPPARSDQSRANDDQDLRNFEAAMDAERQRDEEMRNSQ